MAYTVTRPPVDPPAADGAKAAGWWTAEDDSDQVVCNLCPRHCQIARGKRGFCFVRQNRGGRLVSTTYGRSTGFCVDPIEKKPLNHFYPGTPVLSFGTPGCNLGCRFCQNWTTSRSRDVEAACARAWPKTIARAAGELGCRSVAFTYNDPIIWAEYAIDTARACRDAGVKTVAVTSGYISEQARGPFHELIDAANVDLKAFTDEFYQQYAGKAQLQPVLDTLRYLARETDVWLEVTTLLIPELNDSRDELQRMCRWMVDELGPDVPLHLTAFHPDFEMFNRPATPRSTMLMAHEVAREAGLNYVYTGNIRDPEHQGTFCPSCEKPVIGRDGYQLSEYHIRDGRCAHCGAAIAGRFDDAPGNWGGRRQPVRIGAYARPEDFPVPSQPEAPATDDDPDRPQHDPDRPQLNEEQEQRIFRAAVQRVATATRHERPAEIKPMLAELAGVPLYGAFVSLKRAGQLRSCCGFLGKEIPLGEAVDRAAERAALEDPRFPPISPGELPELDLEVWLLWSPRPVEQTGEDRLGAIEIGRHGVEIARGMARGLLLPGVAVDHGLDAREFLEHVCLKARLPIDAWKQDDTALKTFEGYAIRGRFPAEVASQSGDASAGSEDSPLEPAAERSSDPPPPAKEQPASAESGPSGQREAPWRPPAVAGAFYPGRAIEIEQMLSSMMPAARPEPQDWPAALVPHAGWIYSGSLAAATFARVRIPQTVMIFCPRHRPGGADWAVAPFGVWQLPTSNVAGNPALAERVVKAVDGAELDATAHLREHAIEVQLPILARLRPDVQVLGVALGGGDLPSLQQFGRQLGDLLATLDEPPLLAISSDMNHFADEATTRQVDRLAIEAIASLDPTQLYNTVRGHQISMCGMMGAVVVMEALRQQGRLHRVEAVGYTTSAQRSGDTQRVVGYAGLLLG